MNATVATNPTKPIKFILEDEVEGMMAEDVNVANPTPLDVKLSNKYKNKLWVNEKWDVCLTGKNTKADMEVLFDDLDTAKKMFYIVHRQGGAIPNLGKGILLALAIPDFLVGMSNEIYADYDFKLNSLDYQELRKNSGRYSKLRANVIRQIKKDYFLDTRYPDIKFPTMKQMIDWMIRRNQRCLDIKAKTGKMPKELSYRTNDDV